MIGPNNETNYQPDIIKDNSGRFSKIVNYLKE